MAPKTDRPGARAQKLLSLGATLLLCSSGCTTQTIPCSPADLSGCVVDEIEVVGNEVVSDDELLTKLATAETGTFLEGVPVLGAIDTLTVQYERFDRFVLERDLARIARIYRAKGYYEAIVRAGRVRRIDRHQVGTSDVRTARLLVEIVVEEGVPVTVSEATIEWADWDATRIADADAGAAAQNAKNALSRGAAFTEEDYLTTGRRIERALRDLGFAYATVTPKADVDLVSHGATVRYGITLGPRCTIGDIAIEGLGSLPEWQIRPALGLTRGELFSAAKLESAEVALRDFGVFGAVAVEPVLQPGASPSSTVPIRVRLRPAALGAVRLGGGVELGDQAAVRGVAGWQHKSATGALDRFSVEARPRLVLYPWRVSTLFGETPALVPEVALRVQYTLPFPFDPRTNFFVQSQASIGLPANTDAPERLSPEIDILGEYLIEHRQGIERRFFLSRLLVSLSHNLSFSSAFRYPRSDGGGARDDAELREGLLLSFLDLLAQIDLRKGEFGTWDARRPASGFFASIDTQLGGNFLGGDASDVRVLPEVRFFAPLARGVVVAARLGFGFLHAIDYGFVLGDRIAPADVATDPGRLASVVKDAAILDKRGLFSGGPGSNRGYGFNQIAPHRTVNDAGEALASGNLDAIGGRTRWEASVELRFPIAGALGGVAFADASDVTRRLGEFRADHPHVSLGLGARYDTPVGPLRVDLGVPIPYLQVAGEANPEPCGSDGTPCDSLVVDEGSRDPFALAIAIGNAF